MDTEQKTLGYQNTGLTEDQVKQRFIPFLKDFYRNRYEPVPNTIEVELDNVSEGGLVADGKMTFRKEDGTLFVCTYEATSRDKVEEVKYQLNVNYFLWDCTAFGAVAAAVVYVISFAFNRGGLINLQWAGNIGLLTGVGMIGFFAWHFTMQKWRKYRYIFAIQQFKQYFVDEQWVALAEDVFPGPSDPYLIELRNQCVYNGIGLAIVPLEGNVRKLNDPSRLGMYGKDRKMADWVTRTQWYQVMTTTTRPLKQMRQKAPDSLTVWANKIIRPFHYLIFDPVKKYVGAPLRRPFDQTTVAYTRFMSSQMVQKLIFLLAILVVAPLFWTVISYREENAVDMAELQDWRSGQNPEDEYGYLVDGEAIPFNGEPKGVPKQYPISTKKKYIPRAEEEVATINLSGDDEEVETIDLTADPDEAAPGPPPKTTFKKAVTIAKTTASDPCTQVKNKTGWILQENAFSTKDAATARVTALGKKGISAQALQQSCLTAGKSGWLVWLGNIQSSESAARTAAANLQKTLRKAGFSEAKVLVKPLK